MVEFFGCLEGLELNVGMGMVTESAFGRAVDVDVMMVASFVECDQRRGVFEEATEPLLAFPQCLFSDFSLSIIEHVPLDFVQLVRVVKMAYEVLDNIDALAINSMLAQSIVMALPALAVVFHSCQRPCPDCMKVVALARYCASRLIFLQADHVPNG